MDLHAGVYAIVDRHVLYLGFEPLAGVAPARRSTSLGHAFEIFVCVGVCLERSINWTVDDLTQPFMQLIHTSVRPSRHSSVLPSVRPCSVRFSVRRSVGPSAGSSVCPSVPCVHRLVHSLIISPGATGTPRLCDQHHDWSPARGPRRIWRLPLSVLYVRISIQLWIEGFVPQHHPIPWAVLARGH